ncbi:MAG TPA: tryptophan synthase subunit alpha, partial [Acidobacteriaceae bacterium]|nr:tryptophan synthase subunit alpha [Acidobacteriaceae bacterium]
MAIQFHNQPGLVVYLTIGDPDLATSKKIALAAIDAGADVLELGVPFSDPLADGPVIQRASERAVRNGTRMEDVLALANSLRQQRPSVGLVIFSYLNPILRMGLEAFAAAAETSGVDAVLVTDLIVEESAEYRAALKKHHLQPIFLAAPTSPDSRLARIAEFSEGFIYAISRVGITGTQQQVAGDARELVTRLRRYTKLPIALGFGISNASHVAVVAEYADA